MNILPLDIISEIISYIKNNLITYRTINKSFKQIIDNDLIEKGIVIIITPSMIMEIMNKTTDYFDCVILNKYYIPKYEIYYICADGKWSNSMHYTQTNDFLKTTYRDYIVYLPNEYKLESHKFGYLLPTSKIINYFLNTHTLSQNNKFKEHSLKVTLDWYIKEIEKFNHYKCDKIINYYKSRF